MEDCEEDVAGIKGRGEDKGHRKQDGRTMPGLASEGPDCPAHSPVSVELFSHPGYPAPTLIHLLATCGPRPIEGCKLSDFECIDGEALLCISLAEWVCHQRLLNQIASESVFTTYLLPSLRLED